jgi:hypothetical protein
MFIKKRNQENNLFQKLQNEALEILQKLSGNLWTDFNIHDPGITILDILHYSLFEIQHFFDFPLQEYLKDFQHNSNENEFNSKINFEKLGLFSLNKFQNPTIATAEDYKNSLKNEFNEIINCKFELTKNHKYRIIVETKSEIVQQNLAEKIKKFYHSNRNLCENLEEIKFEKIEKSYNLINDNLLKIKDLAFDSNKEETEILYKNFIEYFSIQNDFPDCYGINKNGISSEISTKHQAKILQFQAFLLIFDFLIEKITFQTNNISKLLEFSSQIPVHNFPEIEIQNFSQLIDENRKKSCKIDDENFLQKQKENYLNYLDLIYGEETLNIFDFFSETLAEKNERRTKLIKNLFELNSNRFKSFNILDSSFSENLAGIQKIIYSIFDIDFSKERKIVNLLSQYKINVLEDEIFFKNYKEFLLNVGKINENFEEKLEIIPKLNLKFKDWQFNDLIDKINTFSTKNIFKNLLKNGNKIENYKIFHKESENNFYLIFKNFQIENYIILSKFSDKNELIYSTNQLIYFLKKYFQESCRFYLIEHILLEDVDFTEVSENWNKLSIISPNWNFEKENFENLLFERLPAHFSIEFFWFDEQKIKEFERIYFVWKKFLTEENQREIQNYSKLIRAFLTK